MTAALCSRLGNEILDIAQKLLVERHHSNRVACIGQSPTGIGRHQ
jgi:hypothetical protein